MSSIPGYTLEAFVMWEQDLIVEHDTSANVSLQIAEALGMPTRRVHMSIEKFKEILKLYEPYREQIETKLLDFDEDNQSWRDYAGYNFDFIDKVSEQAWKLR